MSFASDVKKELTRHIPKSRHCQIAELAALVLFDGNISVKDGHTSLGLSIDNKDIQSKYFTLVGKTSNIDCTSKPLQDADALDLLTTLKMVQIQGTGIELTMDVADQLLLQQTCCKKTFLRGAFLCAGSVTNPNKAYHFEIVCKNMDLAQQVQGVMQSLELDAKIVERKGHFVVYLKEGSQIITILGMMEASVAYMAYENARIVKEMRNDINRQVNCETANISKTVNAAVRQIEDITLIQNTDGLDSLPENLREIAYARLQYPDLALKDLGEVLTPAVGKSGVNHRLRRISEIANKLRN